MKKALVLLVAVALVLAGCSGSKDKDNKASSAPSSAAAESSAPASSEAASTEAASSEPAGAEVTVVFPAVLNEDGDVEGMTAEIKEAGATNIVANDDGSATATISQENLNKLLDKYRAELDNVISGLKSGGDSGSIKDLAYDENTFKEFNLTVDRAAYESSDGAEGLVFLGLAMQSMMFQVYSGVDVADISVTFNLIDESTGETFSTETFPQAE